MIDPHHRDCEVEPRITTALHTAIASCGIGSITADATSARDESGEQTEGLQCRPVDSHCSFAAPGFAASPEVSRGAGSSLGRSGLRRVAVMRLLAQAVIRERGDDTAVADSMSTAMLQHPLELCA